MPRTLCTHPKPFTSISGPSHSSQVLHTHLKTFTSISGPPYASLTPTLFLGDLQTPQTLHTSLRSSLSTPYHIYPSKTFHTHPRPSRSFQVPPHPPKALHTHVNPYPHIQCPPYTPKPPISIPCPPHTSKDNYTHLRHSMTSQSPSH